MFKSKIKSNRDLKIKTKMESLIWRIMTPLLLTV